MIGFNFWVPLSLAQKLALSLGVALSCALAVIAWRAWRARRLSPEELEQQRRHMLMASGKMGDATLLELQGDFVFYSYDVRGVEYTASQDVSSLRQYLAEEASVEGPVAVKYDSRNPANSIILSEEWSGLRLLRPHS